jgi:sec-independent protein translocase protein TatC
MVLMLLFFVNKTFVFEKIILAPSRPDFFLYRILPGFSGFHLDLINIELSAQFFTHLSVSMALSIILAVPYILYQLWNFVRPALYENEKRVVKKLLDLLQYFFLLE